MQASEQVLRNAGAHWSVGEQWQASTNTFLNERLSLRLAPAIEYNVFPYAEATRRRLTVEMSSGLVHLWFMEALLHKWCTKQLRIRPRAGVS